MPIVRVLFRSTAEAAERGPEPPSIDLAAHAPLLQDLLWAHAVPADGLDHVRVRPFVEGRGGTDAAVFIRADSDAAALDRVRALIERVQKPIGTFGYTAEVPSA